MFICGGEQYWKASRLSLLVLKLMIGWILKCTLVVFNWLLVIFHFINYLKNLLIIILLHTLFLKTHNWLYSYAILQDMEQTLQAVGQVISLNPDGTIIVHWCDGSSTSSYPQDLYIVWDVRISLNCSILGCIRNYFFMIINLYRVVQRVWNCRKLI